MDEISINDQAHSGADAKSNTGPPGPSGLSTEPQFGLIDVVEAFTAMRHEWRTQSKQNRDLAQSMQASTDLMTRIESTLDQKLTATSGEGDLRKFISLVIDLDISLTRAASSTSECAAETEKTQLLDSVRHCYEQSGILTRTLARPVYRRIVAAIQTQSRDQTNTTSEGIQLILNRLRRMMDEQNLTRVKTIGKTFDGETMKAISAIESNEAKSGSVVEEIAPAYFYNGKLARVAEVRVAK